MKQEQIIEIIKLTLDELDNRHMLVDPYKNILRVVDRRLYKYFDGAKDSGITRALRELSDDLYIDIVYLQYRDAFTIESIADYYNKDVSTIKRNKKRLIKSIYEIIRDAG